MAKQNIGILLDRDGVLIENREDYVKNISEISILDGVPEAISLLWERGYKVCIVTNQSGIQKGLYTKTDVQNVHQHIEQQLLKSGTGEIYWYFCPHHDIDQCLCRKPKPGLLEKAIDLHNLNPTNIWMVGDNLRDIKAGQTIGCHTCLVLTGLGEAQLKKKSSTVPESVCANLYEFVTKILLS